MSAWPERVWMSAALRAVDARARGEIEAAGSVVRLEPGQTLCRTGEPADAFFVVVEGALEVRAVRRGETDASVVRRAIPGDALGEEATLRAGATRAMDVVCAERARVVSVPMAVFRRATGRAGGGAIMARVERTLRRAATRDLLKTTSFTRDLPACDIDDVLDAAEHIFAARGETVFRQGERAAHVYLVADGMLQLQTEDDGRLHVRAYVTRGDVVGESADLSATRGWSAVACGPTWLIAVPRVVFSDLARRHPAVLASVRRVAIDDASDPASVGVTQHLFQDAYRLTVASSLLVIDQDACVRCGHCAWACADAHDDGVSRLVRRGDKVVTAVLGSPDASLASLLIPNSCQHCEHPACMVDCPTGAIGRDPRGEVFIREDLCIGCGACAKACPWDNIQIAPRSRAAKRRLPLARPLTAKALAPTPSDHVAVKCDLCRGVDGGPACVRACPTEAIVRVKPTDVLPALAALVGERAMKPVATRRPAWPWVVGGAAVAVAMARVQWAPMTSGGLSGALVFALVGYVGVKRVSRARHRKTLTGDDVPARSRTRVAFIAHLTIGALALGLVLAHAGARITANVAGALALSFWVTAIAGIGTAIAYAIVPRRLTRLERDGALPEDLALRARELDDRAFVMLSGQGEGKKAIYARILRPYARASWGPLALVMSGATLREEEKRLGARIGFILEGRRDHGGAVDDLVRLVVAQRALPAQKWLTRILRAGLPLHVVATAITVVLLLAHAWTAVARTR